MSWTNADRAKLLSHLQKFVSLSLTDCYNIPSSLAAPSAAASAVMSLYNNPSYTSGPFSASSNGSDKKKEKDKAAQAAERKAKEARKEAKKDVEAQQKKKEEKKARKEKKQKKAEKKARIKEMLAHKSAIPPPEGHIDLVSEINLQLDKPLDIANDKPLSHKIPVVCNVCNNTYTGLYPF